MVRSHPFWTCLGGLERCFNQKKRLGFCVRGPPSGEATAFGGLRERLKELKASGQAPAGRKLTRGSVKKIRRKDSDLDG